MCLGCMAARVVKGCAWKSGSYGVAQQGCRPWEECTEARVLRARAIAMEDGAGLSEEMLDNRGCAEERFHGGARLLEVEVATVRGGFRRISRQGRHWHGDLKRRKELLN